MSATCAPGQSRGVNESEGSKLLHDQITGSVVQPAPQFRLVFFAWLCRMRAAEISSLALNHLSHLGQQLTFKAPEDLAYGTA